MTTSSFREHLPFYFILSIGIGLRIWHINWGLPSLYEEAMPLQISWKFWNWGNEGLSLNPHFFYYSGFTFYLQFLVQSIHYFVGHFFGFYENLEAFRYSYETNITTFVLIARSVTIIFDAGIIVIAYLLTLKISEKRTAIVAAILVTMSFLNIKQSHLINVDTPLAFFSMLSVLFMYRLYCEPKLIFYILTGISIGLATATKYNGGLLFIVFILVHLLNSSSHRKVSNRLFDKSFIVGLIVGLLTFLIFNPYLVLAFGEFYRDFSDVQTHMEMGHLGLDSETTTVGYYFFDSLPRNLGWPLLFVALASTVYLIIRKREISIIILSFPIIYITTICLMEARADRYIFPAIPFLLLVSSLGIVSFCDSLIKYIKDHRIELIKSTTVLQLIICSVLMFITLTPMFSSVWKYHSTISLPDTRTIAKDWLKANIKMSSVIATGPFAIDIPKDTYSIIPIPFNAGNTERTFPFYDARWYEDIDLVITSDYDYGRYLQDRERFGKVLQFYDTLQSRWKLTCEIKPTGEYNGPTFWFYQPPLFSPRDSFSTQQIYYLESASDSAEFINFAGKLGVALYLKDKFQKSIQLLRLVLKYEPSKLLAREYLIQALLKVENSEEALSEISKYLEAQPRDAEMFATQGEILLNLQRLEEAEVALLKSLELNDKLETPYLNLNIVYSYQGNKEKVIDILRKYLTILLPEDERYRLVKQRIEVLTNSSN